MLSNVILTIIALEGGVSIGLAYKVLKSNIAINKKLSELDSKLDAKTVEIKQRIEISENASAKEIKNRICELAFTGIKMQQR
jgi:hypothetical protein